MKLAFLGTSEFAVPALTRWSMPAMTWSPSTPARPSPPAAASRSAARRCTTWRSRSACRCARRKASEARKKRTAFKALDLDAAVVVVLRPHPAQGFLDAPVLGCINIHGSLLPRWRGAAPIHRAILAGDAETGVTTMRMDEGLDTGPMLLAERTPISAADTAETRARPAGGTGRDG